MNNINKENIGYVYAQLSFELQALNKMKTIASIRNFKIGLEASLFVQKKENCKVRLILIP